VTEIAKIVKLLADEDAERRVAAAVVLGALKPKGAAVKDGLLDLLAEGGPEERRVAVAALGQLKQKSTLSVLVDHLTEKHGDVRAAAEIAVMHFGEAAVAELEKRRDAAEHVGDRRAFDAALARTGGQDAFGVLLEGLAQNAAEGGREAAMQVRQRIKMADAKEKKTYLSQTLKFLKRKDVKQSPDAQQAALKILGYLEDKKGMPAMLEHIGHDDVGVRVEAIIALRFAMGQDRQQPPEVALKLLDVVNDDSKELSRAAVDTLTNLDMPAKATPKLLAIAQDAHPERARFAVDKLKLQDEDAAKKALVELLLQSPLGRAELAATALEGEKRAITPCIGALGKIDALPEHAPRVVLICAVLQSAVDQMSAAQKKRLIEHTVTMVEEGTPGYESAVKVAREADSKKAADGLRALAAKLRKKKKNDRAAVVLGMLERGGEATDEDRFRRAMIALKQSRKDTKPNSRQRDPALKLFQELVDDKVDLWPLLKKERSLDNEERFYLGWHFIEEGEPLGEDLLDDVIKRGPRTKLARMARNKKKLELED
jgi:HEAT repeat protein